MLKATYSIDKDILNYLNVFGGFKYLKHGRNIALMKLTEGFPQEFLRKFSRDLKREEAIEIVRGYLRYQHPFLFEYIARVIRHLQILLDSHEGEIVNKLETLYGTKFPFANIDMYITTLKICPHNYGEKWFMVSIYGDKDNHLKTTLHELNHFMFYYYFGNLEKKLGTVKFESLKEALTVLTNPEEEGYPAERKLRGWLKEQEGTLTEIIKKGEWKKIIDTG